MDKFIPFQNATIHYRRVGKGIPVVLIHGFAEDQEIWQRQVEALQDKVQFILPDIPGSGRSTFIAGEGIGIEHYAEGIRRVVEAEQLDKFALIGHSMGGYVALAYAEKWPQSLTGLGLFHSTAYPDNEEKIANRKRGIAFIQTHGPQEFLKQAIPNLFSEGYKKEQPADVQKLIHRATNFSGPTLVQYYEAMMVRPNRTGLLKSLEIPILFIIGEEDKTLNLQDGLTQACMPALSHLFLFPRAAHMGMWESTHRSNTSMMKFLDQQKEP